MLTRVYRDPWDSFREFRGELDKAFNRDLAGYTETASDWVPSVDIKEGKDAYEVVADVPGVNPKDIDISLEDGVLTVKGERKSESKDESDSMSNALRMSAILVILISNARPVSSSTSVGSDQSSSVESVA